VPRDVTLGVFRRDNLVVLTDRDDDGALEVPDERVSCFDSRVEDADARSFAARASQRPIAGDALGPLPRESDAVDRILRQAPGGKRSLARILAVGDDIAHGWDATA
jgi:hypothetical protein